MAAPGPGGTAVELRSADFSPPPLGTCKSAGSGMNSALQVRRNWLNSTAVACTAHHLHTAHHLPSAFGLAFLDSGFAAALDGPGLPSPPVDGVADGDSFFAASL